MAVRAELAAVVLPRHLGFFEATLQESESGWLVGNSVTIADLKLMPLVRWFRQGILDGIPPSFLDAFPAVLAHMEKVLALPAVAAWNEKVAARKEEAK